MSLRELLIFNSRINHCCLNTISRCRKLETLDIGYSEYLNFNDGRTSNIFEKLKSSVKEFN